MFLLLMLVCFLYFISTFSDSTAWHWLSSYRLNSYMMFNKIVFYFCFSYEKNQVQFYSMAFLNIFLFFKHMAFINNILKAFCYPYKGKWWFCFCLFHSANISLVPCEPTFLHDPPWESFQPSTSPIDHMGRNPFTKL